MCALQAMITAAFSIVRQSMTLGCFPRLQIIQTNARIRGQIYIPEINYALMCLSIAAVGGFQTLDKIGSAYGEQSLILAQALVCSAARLAFEIFCMKGQGLCRCDY